MTDLFNDYKPSSANQWKKRIITDLKGKSFESLISEKGTLPFFHADNTTQNPPILKKNSWHICQLIDATNATQANQKALLALENEVSTLCFSNPKNLETLLEEDSSTSSPVESSILKKIRSK